MKYVLVLAALAAFTLPANAGYHCYVINGKMICCSTYGNIINCN